MLLAVKGKYINGSVALDGLHHIDKTMEVVVTFT